MKDLSSLDMKLDRLIFLKDQIHVIREEREDLISEMFQVAEREGPANPKLAKYFNQIFEEQEKEKALVEEFRGALRDWEDTYSSVKRVLKIQDGQVTRIVEALGLEK